MDVENLDDGEERIEVSEEITATGPRLRIRSVRRAVAVDLDPLELEGLTRLPFTTFPPLGPPVMGDQGDAADAAEVRLGAPDPGLHVLRNEFAMVGVGVSDEPDGRRLRVRNMSSGAEILLRPTQLDRLTVLRHRDLAPLVDPSGLAAQAEPDPDQV